MHLEVESLSPVDRRIHIHAGKEDLAPLIQEALKKIRRQVSMPGFRAGQAPMGIIEKRFGEEVKQEEAGKFVENVFRDKILPEHKPVGQPVIEDMHFHGDELHAVVRLALKPEFTLAELSAITLDRMIHDVSEEDVDKEIESVLARQAAFEPGDTVEANSKLTVHSQEVDAAGNAMDTPLEINVEIDLREPGNANLVKSLVGKTKGEKVIVSYDETETAQQFELEIVSVSTAKLPELNDEFAATATNGEAKTVEEYRARIKSRVQSYYDNATRDIAKNVLIDKLMAAHAFDAPELVVDNIVRGTLERASKENKTDLAEQMKDEQFMIRTREQARMQAKWMFIAEAYRDANEEALKVTDADIDGFLEKKATEYGIPAAYMKQVYSQTEDAMERLYHDIADEKLFTFLLDEVTSVDLDRAAYQEKYKRSDS